MHMLQSLFCLTIALHVSGIIITHLQEHRVVVCCYRGRVGTDFSSHSSTIATDNNTAMYIIHYSIEHIVFSTEYTLSTTIVILI